MRSAAYEEKTKEIQPHSAEMKGLLEGLRKLQCDQSPATLASGLEFILEGLYLHRRLNKEQLPGKIAYRA
jgi:magnesium chelatase subunit I